MRVRSALFEQIRGGYFYDDQAAVRAGARADGEWISGDPVTEGFPAVRIPGHRNRDRAPARRRPGRVG